MSAPARLPRLPASAHIGITLMVGAAIALFCVSGAVALIIAFRHGVWSGLLALALMVPWLLAFVSLVVLAAGLARMLTGIQESAEEIAEQSAVIALNTGSSPPPPSQPRREPTSSRTSGTSPS